MRNDIIRQVLVFVHAAWRRRYLIAVPILIMPVLGLVVGLTTPKKYETSSTVLIQEAAMQNPFLQDLAVSTNLKKRIDALTTLLHSRHILTEVAYKTGLINDDSSPEEKGRVIANLSESLKVKLIGDDVVQIKYSASKPEGMVDMLNKITVRFVERIVAPQRSSIYKSRDFLAKEMETRLVDLTKAEAEMAAYKSEHADELPQLHARNVIRLGALKDDLSDRRTALKGAQGEFDTLRKRLSQTNPVIGRIEEDIVAIMGDLAILRARYTNQHSKVRGAMRKLKSLEEQRSRSLLSSEDLSAENLDRLWDRASLVTAEGAMMPLLVEQLKQMQLVENRIKGLEEEVRTLESEYEELEGKVKSYGEHDKAITALQRDIAIKRKIYEDLAQRHQLAQVTGALGKFEETDRVKLVDPPFEPTKPVNLPVVVYVFAGIFAGGMVGVGLAVCTEVLDTSTRTKMGLEKLLNVPVITRIPPIIIPGFNLETGELDLLSSDDLEQIEGVSA